MTGRTGIVYIDLIMHIIGFLNYEEIDYSLFCKRPSLITPRIINKYEYYVPDLIFLLETHIEFN